MSICPLLRKFSFMSRPVKCRRVCFLPGVTYFKPAGIPMRFLSEICLSLEEAESIRLKDLENLDQKQCAEHMNISRPTFQRVLISARKKIADVLLNGKAIRIAGGNYETVALHLTCSNGHEWDIRWTSSTDTVPQCPTCKMPPINSSLPRCWRSNRQTSYHDQMDNGNT
jgi:predicted DNA-binding protein (UPF0251 family)